MVVAEFAPKLNVVGIPLQFMYCIKSVMRVSLVIIYSSQIQLLVGVGVGVGVIGGPQGLA